MHQHLFSHNNLTTNCQIVIFSSHYKIVEMCSKSQPEFPGIYALFPGEIARSFT